MADRGVAEYRLAGREKEVTHPATDQTSDQTAGRGTRRSRGHWGILDNVIGGPVLAATLARRSQSPRAKAAPRRKSVLRYPTLAYQHEQPSHILHGWQPSAPSRSPSGNGFESPLRSQRNSCGLLTERSHINVRVQRRAERAARGTSAGTRCWASDLLHSTADDELRDIAKMPRAVTLRPHCGLNGSLCFSPSLRGELRSRNAG